MITVFADETKGRIKPINGVGQPPFDWLDFSHVHYLKEAGIPFSRLHDAGGMFGGGCFVDIPNIFKCFDADEYDPASYEFAFTDELIKALIDNDVEPFFRLGVTIENYHKIKAYRIFPPKDCGKWARICEMIIRHYTEGWNNGFRFKITYWEIWNEPDNEPLAEDNPMWKGTKEEYFELYKSASIHLKKCFPDLKIGGYASCGFYAYAYNEYAERYRYFEDFFIDFLTFVKQENCPLDFFSWHSYADIDHTMLFAEFARRKLDEYGFINTESICDEWNPEPEKKGTKRHSALTAGMLLAFASAPVDVAAFYDAGLNAGIYGGLINPLTYKPLMTYWSFVMLDRLIKNGESLKTTVEEKNLYAAATISPDGSKILMMLANTSSDLIRTNIHCPGKQVRISTVLEDGIHEVCSFSREIQAESVLLLEYSL